MAIDEEATSTLSPNPTIFSEYSINEELGGTLPAISDTGQLSILQYPIVIYIREVVILNFSYSNYDSLGDPTIDFTTSKSFIEMAVVWDDSVAASQFRSITLSDKEYNEIVTLPPAQPVNPWRDINGNPIGNAGNQTLAIYQYYNTDLRGPDVPHDWNNFVDSGNSVIVENVKDFAQMFGLGLVTSSNAPFYISAPQAM